MSQSQIESFNHLKSYGKDKAQQLVILELLKVNSLLNRKEIETLTGFNSPSVTGRCSELAFKGKIVEHHLSGVTYYSLVHNEALTRVLKDKKKKERTQRILKSVLKDEQAVTDLVNVFLIAMTDERNLTEAFKSEIKNLIK